MSEWDGKERRQESLDHIERDRLLSKIDANLSNFMRRFDDHREEFQTHVKNDENRFGSINDKQEEMKKYVFMGVGILAATTFIIELIFRRP